MYIGGGYDDNFGSQISTISNCGISKVATLPMDFRTPACNTFNDGIEKALICFPHAAKKSCSW